MRARPLPVAALVRGRDEPVPRGEDRRLPPERRRLDPVHPPSPRVPRDEARLDLALRELLRVERPPREGAEVDELRLDRRELVGREGPREVLAEEGVRLVGVREPRGILEEGHPSRITGDRARRDEAGGGPSTSTGTVPAVRTPRLQGRAIFAPSLCSSDGLPEVWPPARPGPGVPALRGRIRQGQAAAPGARSGPAARRPGPTAQRAHAVGAAVVAGGGGRRRRVRDHAAPPRERARPRARRRPSPRSRLPRKRRRRGPGPSGASPGPTVAAEAPAPPGSPGAAPAGGASRTPPRRSPRPAGCFRSAASRRRRGVRRCPWPGTRARAASAARRRSRPRPAPRCSSCSRSAGAPTAGASPAR